MIASRTRPLISRFRGAPSAGYVGVDIGTHAIKVVQVQRQGRSWRLLSARSYRHEQPLSMENPRACITQITDSLDRIWESSGRWFADDAACLLPLSTTLFRNLCLPTTSPAEQRAMMLEELAGEEGLVPDRWCLSFWEDETSEAEAGTSSVSALGVSQELADGVLEALLSRGLACQVMAGLPFVLARAAGMTAGAASAAPVAVVDWGHETALLTVVSHGQPAYTRQLRDCGFRHAVESVATPLGLNPCDVVPLICRSARPMASAEDRQQTSQALRDIVESSVVRLRDELQRTLSFLHQQRAALAPRRLVLCGGGATLRGADQILGDALQIPTTVWDGSPGDPATTALGRPACLYASAIVLSRMRWES